MHSDDSSSRRQIELARLLVARLERLSADSYWAHQASGVRGSLLRALEQADLVGAKTGRAGENPAVSRLQALNQAGYAILERAALEVQRASARELPA